MEDAPDHAVPQLGDTLPDVLDRQTERQQTGILDLDTVVKQSEPDGRSLLGVVCMNDGVHERLPDRDQRNRPAILPADALDDRLLSQVLARKSNSFIRGPRQERPDLHRIEQSRSIAARKTARLNPGIREPGEPVPTEKKKPADRRHLTALVFRGDSQSAPRLGGQLPIRCKELGSSSEVNGFRLQVRDGLLVKRVHPVPPLQLFDLQCLSPSIGRAHADENSGIGSQPFQVVRARVAGVDLNGQHIEIPPRHHVGIRNEARADRVGDEVCEFLFRCKHVGHAADVL